MSHVTHMNESRHPDDPDTSVTAEARHSCLQRPTKETYVHQKRPAKETYLNEKSFRVYPDIFVIAKVGHMSSETYKRDL